MNFNKFFDVYKPNLIVAMKALQLDPLHVPDVTTNMVSFFDRILFTTSVISNYSCSTEYIRHLCRQVLNRLLNSPKEI